METIHADWMAYNPLYSFQNTSFSTGLLALPTEYNMYIREFFFFLIITTVSVEALCAYYKIVISQNN